MNKENLVIKLNEIGLSRKDFAKLSNISADTVNNWNDKNRPVPPWVESWLNNYIKAKVSDDIINAVKPFVEGNRWTTLKKKNYLNIQKIY